MAGQYSDESRIILIVDDNKNNCEMCRVYLEPEGFRVFYAEHGEAGLRLVRDIMPDVILLDIVMPVMDGYRLLEKLKEDPELAEIPVMVHSIEADPGEAVKILRMGANDFLKKPFDIDELIARLERLFAIKSRQDDLQKTSLTLLEQRDVMRGEMEQWSRRAQAFQAQWATILPRKSMRTGQHTLNMEQALEATVKACELMDQAIDFCRRNKQGDQTANILH